MVIAPYTCYVTDVPKLSNIQMNKTFSKNVVNVVMANIRQIQRMQTR